jgi:hypothetical protein
MIPWRVICWWTPAVAVPGGRFIPYTAAQVALRRAARLVCIVVGGMGDSVPAVIPPDYLPSQPFVPIAFYVPPEFPEFFVPEAPLGAQPEAFANVPPASVPEPSTLAVLAFAVGAFAMVRR